jgi:hypothetical protein
MIWFHPQRGAVVTDQQLNPICRRYRGGQDADWRVISEPLPKGFLRGDASKQLFGMGGPEEVFGPLEKVCRDCRATFVFTAAEQKHWYETLGFFIDVTAVRCGGCRRARHTVERARRRYAKALQAAVETPTRASHLEVAQSGLEMIVARGRSPSKKVLENLVAHARRAQRLGAGVDELLGALKKLAR